MPYQPGSLKAVAAINGKGVATDLVRTARKIAKIVLIPDRKSLTTSFDDVANVEVQLLDENGTLVPTAADLIAFTVEGPGKIIGVDSGNIMSTERFQASGRKAYQGRALATLRATGDGDIKLTATVEVFAPVTLGIAAKP